VLDHITDLLRLEIQPHEAIYSNRAASFIALKDYKRALEDCQAGIRLNPSFAKIYKRLFKAHISLGNITDA
jgi:DnaJ family protein C protein 7